MTPPKRNPIPALDTDGRAILRVPLANTALHAKVFPEDFQRLLDAGCSGSWLLNDSAVKAPSRTLNCRRVARLIAGVTDPRVRIHVRDGDPLNLRSDNLTAKRFKPPVLKQRRPRD